MERPDKYDYDDGHWPDEIGEPPLTATEWFRVAAVVTALAALIAWAVS